MWRAKLSDLRSGRAHLICRPRRMAFPTLRSVLPSALWYTCVEFVFKWQHARSAWEVRTGGGACMQQRGGGPAPRACTPAAASREPGTARTRHRIQSTWLCGECGYVLFMLRVAWLTERWRTWRQNGHCPQQRCASPRQHSAYLRAPKGTESMHIDAHSVAIPVIERPEKRPERPVLSLSVLAAEGAYRSNIP